MATQKEIQKVWEKGCVVRGKNSDLYRKDVYGNIMFRYSYGRLTEMGWEIDHKKPVSKGGSESIRNKQPSHWLENRRKGSKYPY